jgi:hypothetical protein
MTDIMAHAFRCRAETILILKAVEAGADLAAGMTRERAVGMLTESIVFYEQMLRRYGWGLCPPFIETALIIWSPVTRAWPCSLSPWGRPNRSSDSAERSRPSLN